MINTGLTCSISRLTDSTTFRLSGQKQKETYGFAKKLPINVNIKMSGFDVIHNHKNTNLVECVSRMRYYKANILRLIYNMVTHVEVQGGAEITSANKRIDRKLASEVLQWKYGQNRP